MKIETNIKLLLLLTLILSIGVLVVPAEKTKPAVRQDIWQDVNLDVWNGKFSVPNDLKAIPQKEEDKSEPTEDDCRKTLVFKHSKPLASQLKLEKYS